MHTDELQIIQSNLEIENSTNSIIKWHSIYSKQKVDALNIGGNSPASFNDRYVDARWRAFIYKQGKFNEFISPTKGYLRETCKSQNINSIYLTLSSRTISFRS